MFHINRTRNKCCKTCNFILSIEMASKTGACLMQFLVDGSEICTEAPVLNASLAACDISEEPVPALVLSSTASGTEASEGAFESGHATTTARIDRLSERMDPDAMGPDIQSSSWSAMVSADESDISCAMAGGSGVGVSDMQHDDDNATHTTCPCCLSTISTDEVFCLICGVCFWSQMIAGNDVIQDSAALSVIFCCSIDNECKEWVGSLVMGLFITQVGVLAAKVFLGWLKAKYREQIDTKCRKCSKICSYL